MDNAKGIGEVQPAHTQRSLLPPSLTQYGQKLEAMFGTARHSINKGLLYGGVQVVVLSHVVHPALLQQAGDHEHLANAGGQAKAMGRKFLGSLGSSTAFFFPSSLSIPTFQAAGTLFTAQQELNR